MKEDTTYDRIERSLFKDQEEAARTLPAESSPEADPHPSSLDD